MIRQRPTENCKPIEAFFLLLLRPMSPIIQIADLNISAGAKSLLQLPQFTCNPGEVHAVVGESGSGKSLLLNCIMQLLPQSLSTNGTIKIEFNANSNPVSIPSLLELSKLEKQRLRGKYIGMVFQEPMSALNPQMTCGAQLMEAWNIHCLRENRNKSNTILQKLQLVGLAESADRILKSFPHQLSGGQRQRVMIVMATLHNPPLVLADEPTTALDFTSRKQVMDDFLRIVKSMGSTLIWVSHELDLVQEYAQNVTVLRKGKFVQNGTVQQVFHTEPSEYVKDLLKATPKAKSVLVQTENVTVRIRELSKSFGKGASKVVALKDFSVELGPGQTLAIIGTSGSGKSTLAKLLVGLESMDGGSVEINGEALPSHPPTGVQMVFQDPYASLNRRFTSFQAISEILRFVNPKLNANNIQTKSIELLEKVGFDDRLIHAKPDQMSGGQRQRLCIAKALATNPQILILDEAVAALDPLIQKQILELLTSLQIEKKLIYLFITHNLDVAKSMADKWCFLSEGNTQEMPKEWA